MINKKIENLKLKILSLKTPTSERNLEHAEIKLTKIQVFLEKLEGSFKSILEKTNRIGLNSLKTKQSPIKILRPNSNPLSLLKHKEDAVEIFNDKKLDTDLNSKESSLTIDCSKYSLKKIKPLFKIPNLTKVKLIQYWDGGQSYQGILKQLTLCKNLSTLELQNCKWIHNPEFFPICPQIKTLTINIQHDSTEIAWPSFKSFPNLENLNIEIDTFNIKKEI